MKFSRLLGTGTTALFASALLVALSSATARAHSQDLHWHRIFGLIKPFNVVGVGTTVLGGPGPWVTTSGNAEVDPQTGKVHFCVKGLVLAVGSEVIQPPPNSETLGGLGIGTNAGVTMVKGTLVCNVSGMSGGECGQCGSASEEDDTDAVPLSFKGDASLSGSLESDVPSVCLKNPQDTAFLIRIVEPVDFADHWIAAGGVLSVEGH